MTEIKSNNLAYEQAEIDKLLSQYKRYMELGPEILKAGFSFEPNAKENQRRLTAEKNKLNDEMKFQNPIIWLWYKAVAYATPAGNKNEKVIDFYEDTKAHLICGARMLFLEHHLGKTLAEEFGEDTQLLEVAKSKKLQEVVGNANFMRQWKEFENKEVNGKADKWFTATYKNYRSDSAELESLRKEIGI